MQPLSRQPRLLIYPIYLGVALTFSVQAQTNISTPPAQTNSAALLAPEAQAALDKGLSAARQQEWEIAIQSFQGARKLAPDAPEIYYDLGLAESKVPGRELRAICWFEAYLALNPIALNASAVHQQIVDLDVRAEGDAQKMIQLLEGPAAHFSASKKGEALASIASLLVRCGDLDSAEVLEAHADDDNAKSEVQYQIGLELAKSDRFADAIKLAEQSKSDEHLKISLYKDIADAQIEAGLLADAKSSLDVLSATAEGNYFWESSNYDPYYEVLFRLAEAEYESGQHDQAIALLGNAQQSIDTNAAVASTVKDHHVSRGITNKATEYRIELAVAKYRTGEPAAGQALLQQMRNSLGDLSSVAPGSSQERLFGGPYGARMDTLEELAIAFNAIGQREQALQCLDDAAEAQIAGNEAGEINPYAITYKYMEMEEWDRAKAQAHREVEDYYKGSWEGGKDKKDFVTGRLHDIAAAKIAKVYTSAKAASLKTLADPASSPSQRAEAWCDYVNSTLNTPLFTDFMVTLEGLANRAPGEEDYEDTTIFGLVDEQCEVFVNRLQDVRGLCAKQVASAGKQP
jgi:hypothetical protein